MEIVLSVKGSERGMEGWLIQFAELASVIIILQFLKVKKEDRLYSVLMAVDLERVKVGGRIFISSQSSFSLVSMGYIQLDRRTDARCWCWDKIGSTRPFVGGSSPKKEGRKEFGLGWSFKLPLSSVGEEIQRNHSFKFVKELVELCGHYFSKENHHHHAPPPVVSSERHIVSCHKHVYWRVSSRANHFPGTTNCYFRTAAINFISQSGFRIFWY